MLLRWVLASKRSIPLTTIIGNVYPLIVGSRSPRIYLISSHPSLGASAGISTGRTLSSTTTTPRPAATAAPFVKPAVVTAISLPPCSALTCLVAKVFPSLSASTRYVTGMATVPTFRNWVWREWTWKPGGSVWWAADTDWGMSKAPGIMPQLLKLHIGWALVKHAYVREFDMMYFGGMVR